MIDTTALDALRRKVILKALFDVEPCPDGEAPGRACRYCEATAVVEVLAGIQVPL